MELREFKQIYLSTVAAIHQTHVAALVSSVVLDDFPRNLPQPTRTNLIAEMRELADALTRAADAAGTAGSSEREGRESRPREMPSDALLTPILSMLVTTGTGGGDLRRIDFGSLLYAQDLVTTLAHLDGFTADVLKAICSTEPRLLRRRKQLSWEDVLDAGSWEALMLAMIETYAFEAGWKTLDARLKLFEDDLGMTITVPPEDREILEDAYQMRHILVHSGGRVTREHLFRTGRADVALGQRLTVDHAHAARANSAAVIMCGEVFVAAATKFFGAGPEDFTLVWRRSTRDAAGGAV